MQNERARTLEGFQLNGSTAALPIKCEFPFLSASFSKNHFDPTIAPRIAVNDFYSKGRFTIARAVSNEADHYRHVVSSVEGTIRKEINNSHYLMI